MKVRDFLKSNPQRVVTTRPQTAILEAMALLIENQIGYLPVINDKDEILGIISEREIFRAAFDNPAGFTQAVVGDLMTTDPIVGIPDDDLDYIAGVMSSNRLRRLPIVENRRLVGLLSLWDMVRSQLKNVQAENRYLRKYINNEYPG
jgi:CBS domain-containing protein